MAKKPKKTKTPKSVTIDRDAIDVMLERISAELGQCCKDWVIVATTPDGYTVYITSGRVYALGAADHLRSELYYPD